MLSVESKRMKLNILRHKQKLLKLLENIDDTLIKPRIQFDPREIDKLLSSDVKQELDVKIIKEESEEVLDSADDSISIGSSDGCNNASLPLTVTEIDTRRKSSRLEAASHYTNPPSVMQEDIYEGNLRVNDGDSELSNKTSLKREMKKRNVEKVMNKYRLAREETKINRMSGKAYWGYRRDGSKISQDTLRDERKMLETCTSSVCKNSSKRFCGMFNECQRSAIFNNFWNINWDEKKMFVINTVTIALTNTSTVSSKISRRSVSYKYHLKFEQFERQQVCKKMYLNTLGVKEWMVQNWVQKTYLDFSYNNKIGRTLQCSFTEKRKQNNNIKEYYVARDGTKYNLKILLDNLSKTKRLFTE